MFTDKKEYSFSTCWNIKRHTTGQGMMEEIKSLGFRQVELNYNVTDEMLQTIEPMIERGEMGISSVHNTFPHVADPDYGTDSVLLGFDDEPRRKRAIELLLRSAEYAHRYGARAVVVHPGEVPFEYNIDEALKKKYHDQGPDSAAYQSLWQEMIEKREAGSAHYLKRIQESLEEVCELSEQRGYGVNFGIETRSRCYQMPTLHEAGTIIGRMKGAPLGLWYDIGHGMMMDRMGLYDNVREANELIDHVVGVHIHETVGLSDHWCPYVHSKDMTFFDSFLDIIDRSPVKVYELKAACTAEEIDESHRLITARIAERQAARQHS